MERGEQVVYNLSGQRVNKTSKGLYIVNGQKVVVK
jgi:phage gp45-like